jgi:hypothetical protein
MTMLARTEDDERDWSGWERWLRAHLDIERNLMIEGVAEAMAASRQDLRDELAPRLERIERKLARLAGAVDVLRGKEPPPPGKFPAVQPWEDTVFHAGDVVSFNGSTYQARKDTARVPSSHDDWICLASAGAAGKSPVVRGTYDPSAAYGHLDVVVFNGSAFIAKRDDPGLCPGVN